MTDNARLAGITALLQYLYEPGQVIEIRIISEEGISSGYYDNFQTAATDLLNRETDKHVTGIYATLNEVNPALLARRANRIKYRLGKKDSSTADADIIRRRWLPIDIDPVRPSGVSSSEEEHASALSLAETISSFLSGLNWPEPLVADSGNGAHLLYPIELPNDDQSKILIQQILELLDIRFSNSRCRVDTANFNAARIWKVYGTISRKGDNLPDRPHRISRVLALPPRSRLLDAETLTELLSIYQPAPRESGCKGGNRSRTRESKEAVGDHVLDLAKWFNRFNLTYTAKPYFGGTLYVLDTCPFSDSHSDGAYAIQFESGAIFAGCHHDSCGGGKQRWAELRQRYDPPREDIEIKLKKQISARIRAKFEAEGRLHDNEISASDTSPVEDILTSKTMDILTNGDPLALVLETFSKRHEGDRQVACCLAHSLISRTVLNSKGLHVSISGESGKGKSHAMETMRSLVPPEYRIDGRVSDKALFYMENLVAGTVISLDDVSLSDQMQEILKGVTSSFQKPFPYRTVNKDRKPQTCIIPERCVWWLAKVEGVGDDQVFNRMLTCWIDDTEEQDQKVLEKTLFEAGQLPGVTPNIDEDIRICQQMWKKLNAVWVVIPYATRIRFQSAENRRNPDMLLDLIRTHAAIFQYQRERQVINDSPCIVATIEDFNEAAKLFMALNGETGSQGSKLTKREAALVSTLSLYGHHEVTIAELQRKSGWTSSSIAKLFHGYNSHGKTYSGILSKCPAVSYLDRTVIKGDDGQTTTRRTTVYRWDQQLYDSWKKGGSVWLVKDEDSPYSDSNGDNNQIASSGENKENTLDCFKEEDTMCLSDDHVSDTGDEKEKMQSGCSFSSIDPKKFVHIDGFPKSLPCSVCGKKPVQYQEKRSDIQCETSEVRKRMLCFSCYQRAVSREVTSLTMLPGVTNTQRLVHRDVCIGTCDLCKINSAEWSNPIDHTKLCNLCYEKAKQMEDIGFSH
ncbi:MAG TPA: hypothetical protein VN429_09180 [Methanospirillum sp.]|uniref:hypothetical protein n=1 Tax=Methanospirillum sp. TaxID=45200 RepID=UPI002CA49C28|nr:hypothetical protein [Methanospirillum sp.]HWQ64574.1 hypothetical protein [Methanospirillum sp.]